MCRVLTFSLCLVMFSQLPAFAADRAEVEQQLETHLSQGDLAAAAAAMEENLAADQDDSHSQYGLGMVRLLQSVEHLAQNLYRYGLQPSQRNLPVVRLPVPSNPDPEEITYEKMRAVLQQFVDELALTADTLEKVDDEEVKLIVPIGLVRLDLDQSGSAEPDETFWKIFQAVAWRAAKLDEKQQRFEIGFDRADVHWMIGYTHLLRAMLEAWMAHDTHEFHEMLAPLLFPKSSQWPDRFRAHERTNGFDVEEIADLMAAIHLMRFDVTEPERMSAAREHLLTMIEQSRECWKYILKETDDEREWIPNAKQTSLTPLTVTDARIESWKRVLGELEYVLNGEKLIPHWRLKEGLGINMKRVFEEPQRFDLVMWIHGSGVLPYVEEGDVVSSESAQNIAAAFQGRFLAFAIWFQ